MIRKRDNTTKNRTNLKKNKNYLHHYPTEMFQVSIHQRFKEPMCMISNKFKGLVHTNYETHFLT